MVANKEAESQAESARGVNGGTAGAARSAEQSADGDGLTADAVAVWDATRALADSVRGFAAALVGLARSEWTLARASWPLVFAIIIVLVGLSLSLWASSITLVGWGLYVATGSVGWALVALVLLHVVLLLAARWLLRRSSRHLTMPGTRAELKGLMDRVRGRENHTDG